MIRLSLEIPTAYLERFTPQTDLDFVLAHKVLADKTYARFYASRPMGREVILDNSTHEFGRPMPLEDLRDAAHTVHADTVIVPDIVTEDGDEKQYVQNIIWLCETARDLQRPLGAVLCGRSAKERDDYVIVAQTRVHMLCFTFHEPRRLEWWRTFSQLPHYRSLFRRIHILGVSTLPELQEWVRISGENPYMDFSVDTTKPFKWGVQGRRIDDGKSIRGGGGVDAQAVLNLENLSEEQLKCVEYNINVLRQICQGKP